MTAGTVVLALVLPITWGLLSAWLYDKAQQYRTRTRGEDTSTGSSE